MIKKENMEETVKIELHEKKFIFTGEDLSNANIDTFKFSLNGKEEHKDLEIPALFQEVTNDYINEDNIKIVGYSILEHLPQEKINELFSFEIDGKKLLYKEFVLPMIIFNDQDAEQWQLELMKIVLTEKEVEEIEEEVGEPVEEVVEEVLEEEKEADGLTISFTENEKPVVTKVLDGEKTEYQYTGEIDGVMTFANGESVIEYDVNDETLKEVN